jgi:hypothetical protein
VGGAGTILTSTDGGNTWTQQVSGTSLILYSVQFRDANNGTAVGEGGVILTTTDGGSVFVHQISSEVPDKYSLKQNYPNPFNPNTKIKFDIKVSGFTTLKVFDILGKEVATLINGKLQPGTYESIFDGNNVKSGVYFFRLQSGSFSETKKMILVK